MEWTHVFKDDCNCSLFYGKERKYFACIVTCGTSTLKTEVARASEMLATIYKTTRRHVPDNTKLIFL